MHLVPHAAIVELLVGQRVALAEGKLAFLVIEEIKQTIEDKLFEEAKANPEYAQNAWNVTVHDLENLFQAVVESAGAGSNCTVSVLLDETL